MGSNPTGCSRGECGCMIEKDLLATIICPDCAAIDGLSWTFVFDPLGKFWSAVNNGSCVILNPGTYFSTTLICLRTLSNTRCEQYQLKWAAYECTWYTELTPAECACGPPFRLRFNGFSLVQPWPPLCTCDCSYPVSYDVEITEAP